MSFHGCSVSSDLRSLNLFLKALSTSGSLNWKILPLYFSNRVTTNLENLENSGKLKDCENIKEN